MNQSQDSKITFKNTLELMRRLNINSQTPQTLEAYLKQLSHSNISKAMNTKPAIHRFPNRMTQHIYASVELINKKYDSSPEKVFAISQITPCKFETRLQKFKGIGPHKAAITSTLITMYLDNQQSTREIADLKNICPSITNSLNEEFSILYKLSST